MLYVWAKRTILASVSPNRDCGSTRVRLARTCGACFAILRTIDSVNAPLFAPTSNMATACDPASASDNKNIRVAGESSTGRRSTGRQADDDLQGSRCASRAHIKPRSWRLSRRVVVRILHCARLELACLLCMFSAVVVSRDCICHESHYSHRHRHHPGDNPKTGPPIVSASHRYHRERMLERALYGRSLPLNILTHKSTQNTQAHSLSAVNVRRTDCWLADYSSILRGGRRYFGFRQLYCIA